MKAHHTKTKGDIGVLKAIVDLAEKGWTVLLPMTEHAPFDLVAYNDGEFKRIQVKYRAINAQNRLEVAFKSSWADKNGTHIEQVNKDDFDMYCIYCPDTNKCYYFDPKEFNGSATFRLERPVDYECIVPS